MRVANYSDFDRQIEKAKLWLSLYLVASGRPDRQTALKMRRLYVKSSYLQEVLRTVPFADLPSYLLSREGYRRSYRATEGIPRLEDRPGVGIIGRRGFQEAA